MSRICAAVVCEMTRSPRGVGLRTPPTSATIRGLRMIPPLAIAEYAVASCSGVTDSP